MQRDSCGVPHLCGNTFDDGSDACRVGPDCCTEVHLRIPGVLRAAVALSSPGNCDVLHVGVHADTASEVQALAWKMPDNLVFQ